MVISRLLFRCCPRASGFKNGTTITCVSGFERSTSPACESPSFLQIMLALTREITSVLPVTFVRFFFGLRGAPQDVYREGPTSRFAAV